MYYCLHNYGCRFIWLTDDNFVLDSWSRDIAQELIDRGISEDIMWFVQARCDDVIRNKKNLPILRRSGLRWVLLGVESSSRATLKSFRKNITPEEAKMSVELLKRNDIFTQAMIIIGDRRDSRESISEIRKFVNELDPDFAIFAMLTPFPGTAFFEEARKKDWIEDFNWSNYDMIHAIMPTEALSRKELQEELYGCYRSFYGSWNRRVQGLFSRNKLKRRIYWYMVGKGIMNQLKKLFEDI
jgi:anaerobic magnesium-protoporphyrin IX monomethyl ester cyclase